MLFVLPGWFLQLQPGQVVVAPARRESRSGAWKFSGRLEGLPAVSRGCPTPGVRRERSDDPGGVAAEKNWCCNGSIPAKARPQPLSFNTTQFRPL